MQIALSGTHGTGKTTSVFETGKLIKINKFNYIQIPENPNIMVLVEVARDCPLPINKKTTRESQSWIFNTQLKRELELSYKFDIIIQDRPIFDSIAYTFTIDENLANSMLDYACQVVYYDLIIFKRVINNNWLVDDGVREVDPDYQSRIEEILMNLYSQDKVKNRIDKFIIE